MSTHAGQPPTMAEYLERARAAQQAVDELGMGAPKPPPNAHDVEEAMRPYLGRVHDAAEATEALGLVPVSGAALELVRCQAAEMRALNAALDHLLDLNGVHR